MNTAADKLPDGWKWSTIRELTDDIQTGPFGAQLHKTEFVPIGVPVLGVGNVLHGRIDLRGIVYVTEEKALELSRYLLQTGDVLFTRSGSVGRAAVLPVEA